MKSLQTLSALLLCLAAMTAGAQDRWMHIYQDKSFTSAPVSNVDSITFIETKSGYRARVHYHLFGDKHTSQIPWSTVKKWTFGPNVPTFHFTTDNPEFTEVDSKVNYVTATLDIDGAGIFDDFNGSVQLRGRGNSTWNMPKKAYRVKLPEKTKLCGYRKAKNYVLLANYIDDSMMRNQAACLATQYSGMPFPTHATPVDVYINKTYKGSYMLIEKVGINNGSVNMPAAQEAESCMFQLDVSYDEVLKVKSPIFDLPLMHKDPDVPDDAVAAKTWFTAWCEDFFEMEKAVASGDQRADYLDYTTLAQYLLVYNICCNQELNHPKSVYMYKTKGGKWNFGPCWDFDWAFGHSPSYRAQQGGELSAEERERQRKEALELALQQYGYDNWGYVYYNGLTLMWTGWDFLVLVDGSFYLWPEGAVNYAPSYNNYLLGVYKNNSVVINGDAQMGNGGEFFLSMIIDNPEFMAEYKRVWEEFESNLPSFWEDFEAYATMLEPSAAHDATVWVPTPTNPVDSEFMSLADGSNSGAIEQLRQWLKKRIEFISKPENNYGLYDPNSTYVRGTLLYKN